MKNENRNDVLLQAVTTLASSALSTGLSSSANNIRDAVSKSMAAFDDIGMTSNRAEPSEYAYELLDTFDKKLRFLSLHLAIELGYKLEKDKDAWLVVHEVMRRCFLSEIDDATRAWVDHSTAPSERKFRIV